MGPCCVDGCQVINEDTVYFEFPTSRGLRKKWQEAVRLPSKIPLGSVVCNRHFNQTDLEHYRGKVRLKRKVVPSLLLDAKISEPPDNSSSDSENLSESAQNVQDKRKSTESTGETQKSTPSTENSTKDTENSTGSFETNSDSQRVKKKNSNVICNEKMKVNKAPCKVPEPKDDIEEMITNYQIKNKFPNTALLPEPDIEPIAVDSPTVEPEVVDVDNQPEPVFIEISVDKDGKGEASQDCMMVVESVQVEVDPTALLHLSPDNDEQEVTAHGPEKDDPISLLTSSDDDDVILQEPHIDTVEVGSSDTDEDDMPLVKLVKTNPKSKPKKKTPPDIGKLFGVYDFYCIQCSFSTTNSDEYNEHVDSHSTVFQVCQVCGYTTASKAQFSRHSRKHKEEKKYKCHLCEYRARHKMSLIYHLQSHDGKIIKSAPNNNVATSFKCKKCPYRCESNAILQKHIKSCINSIKMYACDSCDYETKRKNDLKRHKVRRHREYDMDFDDDDYVPNEC